MTMQDRMYICHLILYVRYVYICYADLLVALHVLTLCGLQGTASTSGGKKSSGGMFIHVAVPGRNLTLFHRVFDCIAAFEAL